MRAMRTIPVLTFHAIDFLAFTGDDIDHCRKSHVSVKRRGRTAQHLDMVYFLCTNGIVQFAVVSRAGIKTMTIFHDEDFFLSRGIDAVHRDV